MNVIIIIAGIILIMVLSMVVKNITIPKNLGVNNGALAPMPKSPNAVSSQCDDPEKKVDPIPYNGDISLFKEKIKEAFKSYGNIKIIKEYDNYIYAVSTTDKMKYHDDLEFYFDTESSLIHFRSASRVGYSDMGLNRERYNHLLEKIK